MWPWLIPAEAYELLERCLIVKAQHYTWNDFSGIPGPPPTDWLKETQMGIEELSAYEGRVAYWTSKGMGKFGRDSGGG